MATCSKEPESCSEEPSQPREPPNDIQHKSMAAPPKERVSGYECEFAEHPPAVLQTECPICLLILRNPYQVSCCGYSFCQSCVERVQVTKKPCPTCNEAEFSSFRDKRLQRSLHSLHVRCEHQKDGCQWIGELGEIARHLNEIPEADTQLTGCVFVNVQCVHCAEQVERQHIQAHQFQSCPKRPFRCVYCNDYLSGYDDVVRNHWPVCTHFPVPCPNQCGILDIKQQDLEHHVSNDCPLTIVTCDFHYAGCDMRLPRRDVMRHMNENLLVHMAKLGAHSNKMAEKVIAKDEQINRLTAEMLEKLKEHEQKIDTLERENSDLRKSLEQKTEEITRLIGKQDTLSKQGFVTQQGIEKVKEEARQVKEMALQEQVAEVKQCQKDDRSMLRVVESYVPSFPMEFTMTNFEQRCSDETEWYSEPFHTHPHGYKMCLRVDAHGCDEGTGTHISVSAYLMRGRFDKQLQWPFERAISIRLLNQLEDNDHHETTFHFMAAKDPSIIQRVVNDEKASKGWGEPKFLSHSDLRKVSKTCRYLKNDCLCFQVTRITTLDRIAQLEKRCLAMESRICTPPFDFTMQGFNEYKLDDDVWYSPSFYTHAQGYRLSLRVVANGVGEAKGTHVSLFAHLMRGEFDNMLKWPFRGVVTLQLLNQLEDRVHYAELLDFTIDDPGQKRTGRVTIGERAASLGKRKFVSHSELNYNSTKNCQYLMFNSLCFRVTKVKLKS